MPTYPTIWFIRHGETTWNAERRIQGQCDSELTALGRRQAQQQARILAPVLRMEGGLTCKVSPLRRAQETARVALDGLPFETDLRLAEIDAGAWQGRLRQDVLTERPDLVEEATPALTLFAAAPGGEGVDSFVDRVQDVLSGLDRPTVLVAHGLWGQVLRGLVQGQTPDQMARMSNEQGCVYLLEHGRETVLR